MAWYRKQQQPQQPNVSRFSYIRFLIFCAAGFAVSGVLLLILAAYVFEPHHERVEAHNVESIVCWGMGSVSLALSCFFAALAMLQWRHLKRITEMSMPLILDGQENILYQVHHGTKQLKGEEPITPVRPTPQEKY